MLKISLALMLLLNGTSAGTYAAATTGIKEPQTLITFFDVSELPVSIERAVLLSSADEYVVKCYASNRSEDDLWGFRLLLLVVDSSNRTRSVSSWTESVVLKNHTTKPLSLKPPVRLKVKANDRVVLGIETVVGRQSIWKLIKANNTLKSFAVGEYVVPKVQRVTNQVDAMPGVKIM